MRFHGPPGLLADRIEFRINHSVSPQRRVGFELGGNPLRRRLVGGPGTARLSFAAVVEVGDVVAAAPLSLPTTLENRCHNHLPLIL